MNLLQMSNSIRLIPVLLISFLAANGTFAADPINPENENRKKAGVLIDQLGSEDFDEREEAIQKLIEMGADARTVLAEKQGLVTDPFIQETIARLLRKLNRPTIRFFLTEANGKPLVDESFNLGIISPSTSNKKNQGKVATQLITTNQSGTVDYVVDTPGDYQISLTIDNYSFHSNTPPFRLVELRSGTITPFPVVLNANGKITGSITTTAGTPHSSAVVEFYRLSNARLPSAKIGVFKSTSVGEKGKWELGNVRPGAYKLRYFPSKLEKTKLLASGKKVSEVSIHVKSGETVSVPNVVLQEEVKIEFDALEEKEPGKIVIKPIGIKGLKTRKGVQKQTRLQYFLDQVEKAPDGKYRTKEDPKLVLQRARMMHNRKYAELTKEGTLEFSNLDPGTYKLIILGYNTAPIQVVPVHIEAGKTVDLGEVKFPKGATITGRFTFPKKSKNRAFFHSVIPIPEETFVALMKSGGHYRLSSMSFYNLTGVTSSRSSTKPNGKFSIPHVQVGRYVLAANGTQISNVIIFGAEVKELGETVNLGDILLPDGLSSKLKRNPKTVTIKGTISAPNRPKNSHVRLHAYVGNNFNMGAGYLPKGKNEFSLTVPQNPCAKIGFWLSTTVPGYHSELMYVSPETVKSGKIEDIKIEIKPPSYGDVRVQALDPNGNPIPGLDIIPLPDQELNEAGSKSTRKLRPYIAIPKKTGRNGTVTFTGLASGKRWFGIRDNSDKGWCLSQPVAATILPDQTNPLIISPIPGKPITGKVLFPSNEFNHPVFIQLASLNSKNPLPSPASGRFNINVFGRMALASSGQIPSSGGVVRITKAESTEAFEFNNVPPGKYSLTAISNALRSATPKNIEVKVDSELSKIELSLDSVLTAKVKINNVDELENTSPVIKNSYAPAFPELILIPAGNMQNWLESQMKPSVYNYSRRSLDTNYSSNWPALIDSNGVANISNIPPGTYDTIIAENQPRGHYNHYTKFFNTHISGQTYYLFPNNVSIHKSQDAAAPQPTVIDSTPWKDGKTVKGFIRGKKIPAQMKNERRTLWIMVAGPNVKSILQIPFNQLPGAPDFTAPIFLGDVPEELKIPDLGSFTIKGLPSGEYKVFAASSLTFPNPIKIDEFRLLQTFEIKDEDVQLETIEYGPTREELNLRVQRLKDTVPTLPISLPSDQSEVELP